MKKIFEINEVCQFCGGTGLYVGMAERDGAAVVCYKCDGTGRYRYRHEYEEFESRREPTKEVTRVYQANPGFVIGVGKKEDGRTITLESFGGMPYKEWAQGVKFVRGMEMRTYTCPAWWSQCVDEKDFIRWDECLRSLGHRFSDCPSFCEKEKCWERYDRESKEEVKP